MAVVLKVLLTCNGCERSYPHEVFNSVAEAREHAWAAGWITARACNMLLDFCEDCQTQGKQMDKAATA